MNWGDYYNTHDFWLGIGMPLHDWLVGLGVPGWLVSLVYVVIGAVSILGLITVGVIIAIWAERRFIARLQDRLGPNRVGKFGLLQSVADALKLLSKEIIRPALADPLLHFLAPLMILGASLMTWAIIPWGPGLQVTDLNIGILYLLAFGAIPALGVTIAGWGSTNKYSLFGGMRAVVQYVSYEVPAGIVIVIPVLLARTMSVPGIVQAQSGPVWNWFVFQPVFFIGPLPIPIPIIGLVAFVFYLIAGLAETNRTPFDHVEADSELTGGFTTEYSGMQFALFFLAEYANSIAVGLARVVAVPGRLPHRPGRRLRQPDLAAPAGRADHQGGHHVPGLRLGARHVAALPLRSIDAVCVEAHAARLTGSAQPVGAVRQSEQSVWSDRPARAGSPLGAQATNGIRSGRGQGHADHHQPPRQAARHHPVPRRTARDADLDAWASAADLRGRHGRTALHGLRRVRAGVPGRRHQDRAASEPDQGQDA